MRKNFVVFCNIDDVFSDTNDENPEKTIQKFISLLEKKRIENGCKKITICLITQDDNSNNLEKYYDYFKNNIDNYRVTLGIQYYKYGGIIDGVVKYFGKNNDLMDFINTACSSFMYSACEPASSVLFISSEPNNCYIKNYYELYSDEKNNNANYEYYDISINNEKRSFKNIIEELEKSIMSNIYNNNDDKKESVLMFLSDIDGTIDQIDENTARQLQEALDAKRILAGADKIVINLISNCTNVEYLRSYANLLRKFIYSENIIIDYHFYKDGMLIEDKIIDKLHTSLNENIPTGEFKADKIIYLIDKFSKKYNIKHVCYADDTFDKNCYSLVSSLFNKATFNIEFYSSYQSGVVYFEKNIHGLIESIQKNTHNFTDIDKANSNDICYKIGEKPASSNV